MSADQSSGELQRLAQRIIELTEPDKVRECIEQYQHCTPNEPEEVIPLQSYIANVRGTAKNFLAGRADAETTGTFYRQAYQDIFDIYQPRLTQQETVDRLNEDQRRRNADIEPEHLRTNHEEVLRRILHPPVHTLHDIAYACMKFADEAKVFLPRSLRSSRIGGGGSTDGMPPRL